MTTEPTTEDLQFEAKAAYADLSAGHRQAMEAADYWRQTAETLTTIRSGVRLPMLPNGREDWWDKVEVQLPFDVEDLRAELAALSGVITKAHTIANLYAAAAEMLDTDATQALAETQN